MSSREPLSTAGTGSGTRKGSPRLALSRRIARREQRTRPQAERQSRGQGPAAQGAEESSAPQAR